MAFDKDRYLQEYVRPRRRLRALTDDLPERYAIALPAKDVDISAQVRAVRSVWHAQQPGTAAAAFCKLCIAEDERLKAAHGDAMLTSNWWQDRAETARKAAGEIVERMAAQLRSSYGPVGVVTRAI